MAATNREEKEFAGYPVLGNESGPDLTLLVTRFLRTDTISCFVAELVVAITAILVVERNDGYLLASTSWSTTTTTTTAGCNISTHVHKHLRHHRHHRQMVLLRLVHLVYQVLQALQGHQGLLDLPGHQDHDEEFESTLRLLQCLHCPEEGTDRSSESLNLARRHHAATLREIEIEDRK